MRLHCIFAASVTYLATLAVPISGQTSQVSKTWGVGRSTAEKYEPYIKRIGKEDSYFAEMPLLDYMQGIENRLAAAARLKAYEIRVTNSRQRYAFRHPDEALYISAGLLGYVESESELAGFFAHLLAHGRGSDALGAKKGAPVAPFEQCIMARDYLPSDLARSSREAERQATQAAVSYMKASRYDPEGLLDSLSKLSYQNTLWTRAIASEDILRLRVALEAEAPPEDGYLTDSGDFAKLRERFSASQEIRFGVSSPVPPRILMRRPNENHATPPQRNSR